MNMQNKVFGEKEKENYKPLKYQEQMKCRMVFFFMRRLMLILCLCYSTGFAQTDEKKVIKGKTEESQILKLSWFSEGYESYHPDTLYIQKLTEVRDNYTFILFAGSWCADTRNLLPKFLKTIDAAGIPHDRITMYFLDTRKKSSERLERKYKIRAIPVFIILKGNQETGRIVEHVDMPIEKKLAEIMGRK
jgi:hypothetical protein